MVVAEWLDRDARLRGRSPWRTSTRAAVAEIERRAGDERFVAVLLPASAAEPLGSRKYWPIYEAADRARAAGRVPHRRLRRPPRRRLSVLLPRVPRRQRDRHAEPAASMVAGGMFEAIPGPAGGADRGRRGLGGGAGWSLDAAWELLREDHPRLQRRPSEYIDEHVWFTTQPIEEPDDPQHLVYAIEQARPARTACCSRPTIRTGTSTRPSRRCRARWGPRAAPGDPVRERARAVRAAARADRRMSAMDGDRLRRPLRAGVLRRAAPVPERLLAPVHHRGGDPPEWAGARLPAGAVTRRRRRRPEPMRSSLSACSTTRGPRLVVLNCLTGFEAHRNPYFAAAVASAINDWMREEFLDARRPAAREPRRLDRVDRRRRRRDRASRRGSALRPGAPARAQRPALGPQEQPRDLRRRARARPARSGCTPGAAPARRRPRAASRPPISRTTSATSRSPRPRC